MGCPTASYFIAIPLIVTEPDEIVTGPVIYEKFA